MTEHVRVAVVGGGPAGLTAAAALARRVDGPVLVLEREAATGGIPRHSDHLGYGMRDLHRFVSGPEYGRRLTALAADAGATLETETMVTGWAGDRTLEVTSPRGRRTVTADAVVLATGARERPRPARLIPGDRPDGVYTTGQLQQLVHLHHRTVGTRAVVVGAELVSWSAVLTLREAGCRTVLMTSEFPKPEAYAAFHLPGRLALRVPVRTRTRVVAIHGRDRVTAVDVEDLRTGRRSRVACDTVITTGDWIPDHELARLAGLTLDPATLGPRVDTALATSRPGVFAAGNLLHPVDTADVAALDGRHVADAVLAHLSGTAAPPGPQIELVADAPLRWVAPQLLRPGGPAPARSRLLAWTDEFHRFPAVTARQGGRLIGSTRLAWPAAPGRVFRIPHSVVRAARPDDGPVHLGLRG
ncbi:FAD-dependent oxidoreductase [Dactylosporangium sp. AC04546]|uniref:NAD(P)/FAD-dependent oxidoreductase n=1 Tax=Dactylosporangium sp. AC04546 TaxID=2862460 RepID=UPI001EDEA06A|nr:FAD-dependent oxidoreductase [Dactylosporangium sp. AC04546]WVK88667.1 FAD-dependent oxidoreductase [Dactylosporangium sp. AC04546]